MHSGLSAIKASRLFFPLSCIGSFRQSWFSVPRMHTCPLADWGPHSWRSSEVHSPSPHPGPHMALCVPGFLTSDLLISLHSPAIIPFSHNSRAWFVGVIGYHRAWTSTGALVIMLLLPLSTQAGHDFSYCFEIKSQKISLFFSLSLVHKLPHVEY